MLNSVERECINKFLGYVAREFGAVCREYGVDATVIRNRVEKHKTAENRFRACPLTLRQQAVLSGFLRDQMRDFRHWIATYGLNEKALFNAIKGMVR